MYRTHACTHIIRTCARAHTHTEHLLADDSAYLIQSSKVSAKGICGIQNHAVTRRLLLSSVMKPIMPACLPAQSRKKQAPAPSLIKPTPDMMHFLLCNFEAVSLSINLLWQTNIFLRQISYACFLYSMAFCKEQDLFQSQKKHACVTGTSPDEHAQRGIHKICVCCRCLTYATVTVTGTFHSPLPMPFGHLKV